MIIFAFGREKCVYKAGILLSLFGTYVRVLVAIFHCHPLLRAAHLSVICLLFTSVILLHFGREKRRDTAAPVLPFVGIAVYAVAPLAHWATVAESTSVSVTTFAWLLLPYLQVNSHPPPSLSCAKGGLGVAVYLLCLPEKLLPPGTVDLLGSSHQLWHALIFSGDLNSEKLRFALARYALLVLSDPLAGGGKGRCLFVTSSCEQQSMFLSFL